MASSDARALPINGSAYRRYFIILGPDGRPVSNITWTGSKICKDGATLANATNSVQTVSAFVYYIDFTASEMTCASILWIGEHASAGAPTAWFTLHPKATGGFPVSLEANQSIASVSGSVGSVTALGAGAINAAAIAADAQGGFIPDGKFSRDNIANNDEYTVQFLNTTTGAPLLSTSITGTPTITVKLRDAGTTIVNAQALTAYGDTVTWKYNSAARIPAGDIGIISFGVTHSTYGALSMKKWFEGRDTV